MKISIIIPIYNEEKKIFKSLNEIKFFCRISQYNYEIIAVNDGSTDNSLKYLNEFQLNFSILKILSYDKNKGKGYAIKKGIENADSDIIFFTDCDLSVPLKFIPEFLKQIESGYDMIIGSRRNADGNMIVSPPYFREKLALFFNYMVRKLLLPDYYDTQCGFKCIRTYVGKIIINSTIINRYLFDIDLILQMIKLKYKIKIVGVDYYHNKESNVNVVTDGIKSFIDLIRLYFNRNSCKVPKRKI